MLRRALTAALAIAAILAIRPTLRAQSIDSLLATPAVLCGRFTQSKMLVGIATPVRSRGRFCLARGRGVLWETAAPFPSTLLVTRTEIVREDSGAPPTRLAAAQEPGVRIISDVLFSLLAGDMPALRERFDIASSAAGGEWRASLVPKDAGFRSMVTRIALRGARYVSHVEIQEAAGDRTSIEFSDIVTGEHALTPAEARRLHTAADSAAH
jgi:hypothetical protein